MFFLLFSLRDHLLLLLLFLFKRVAGEARTKRATKEHLQETAK